MTLALQIVATIAPAALFFALVYEAATEFDGIWDWRDWVLYVGGPLYLSLVLLAIWRAW